MRKPDTGDAGEPLLDLAAFQALAAECGWSVAEFSAFYAAGARKELEALRAAAARDDLPELARLAHGARGSSATACVRGMAHAFRRLEQAAGRADRAQAVQLLNEAGAALERVLALLAEG